MPCTTAGYVVKDLVYNNADVTIQDVNGDGTNEDITPIDHIDFGTITLNYATTDALNVSKEKGVIVVSNRNIYNLRGWLSINHFHGSMTSQGRIVTAPITTPLVAVEGTTWGATNTLKICGTLEDAQCGDMELAFTAPLSDRVVLRLGIAKAVYTPRLPYDPDEELNSDGYNIPLGHFCVYGEFKSYPRRFDMQQGFAELFALLPSWEVNLVTTSGGIRYEKPFGKLESTVSYNMSVTTAENKSGYPANFQSIIVTERNSEITGNLSDLDPALYALLNGFNIRKAYNLAGTESIGTIIDMGNTSTSLPDYGIVMRGWYQSKIMVELRFNTCKCYVNGNIDVHNTATRVPFSITPIGVGRMYIGDNEGFITKMPISVEVIVT